MPDETIFNSFAGIEIDKSKIYYYFKDKMEAKNFYVRVRDYNTSLKKIIKVMDEQGECIDTVEENI